jgi:hypothetical protein
MSDLEKLLGTSKSKLKDLLIHKSPRVMSQQERRLNFILAITLNPNLSREDKAKRIKGVAQYSQLLKKLGVD